MIEPNFHSRIWATLPRDPVPRGEKSLQAVSVQGAASLAAQRRCHVPRKQNTKNWTTTKEQGDHSQK